jgi:hypothetical protein
MALLYSAASSRRKNWIGEWMAKEKRTNGVEASGVEASEEVVNAFEAGIVFGRMVESRRPKRHPLWSDDEWLQALNKAVGKKAESKDRENAGFSGEQRHGG